MTEADKKFIADNELANGSIKSSAIDKYLTPEQLARFNKFITGQTMPFDGGELCVWVCDLKRFLNNLPVID
jgi:hypothetical protein